MNAGAGYEIGPIRPPSEASSLLIRVTRNCGWNRCAFCPVYKGSRFELRAVDEIKADVRRAAEIHGDSFRSAFLQDADSLVMPAPELAQVVRLIRDCFPRVRQVTTYARSSTIAKMPAGDLAALKDAGLTRVHVGLESGSMPVLRLVRKGASPRIHAEAGKKVKQAGLSLSEYVMPGLGGKELSEEHAVMTARVLNEIDPDTIRLRTLFVSEGTPLEKLAREGKFVALTDDETVSEIRLFLKSLDGISSRVASDHALNLLMELEGILPEEKQILLSIIDRYLELPESERLLFRLGRRIGLFQRLDDLKVPAFRRQAEELLDELKRSSTESVDDVIYQLMGRYI